MSFFGGNNNNSNNFQQQQPFGGNNNFNSSPLSSSAAAGWPLPNTDSRSLDELRCPMTSDWRLEVQHAMPHLAHLHPSNQLEGTRHRNSGQQQQSSPYGNNGLPPIVPLSRGDAVVHRPTGQKGIYLGRPMQASASKGQVLFCIMRDATVNPPRAMLMELEMMRAANELQFLPDKKQCPFGCGFRIPEDELDVHARLRHGAGGGMNINNSNNNNYQNNQQQSNLNAGGAPSLFGGNTAAAGAVASPTNSNNNNNLIPTTPKKVAGDHELKNHLKKQKKLGEGAQGIVWQCSVEPASRCPQINVENGATSGFLVLKSVKCKDQHVAENRFDQSIRLMKMKTAHLVPYFAVIYDPTERDHSDGVTSHVVHVIMPFYSSGSLTQKIAQQRGKFTEQWLLSVMLQLSNALNLLHGHSPRIVHGDVKPDNILMYGKTDQVLLMDLEASTVLEPVGATTCVADNEGTFEWRAPECIIPGRTEKGTSHVSTATDMWSLGMVAMCLAILPDFPSLPNPDSKNEEMCLNHESWSDSRLYYVIYDAIKAKGYEARTAEIICSLLRRNPKDRPTTHVLNQVVSEHMELMLLSGKFG